MVREVLKLKTDNGLGANNPTFKDIEITEYSFSSPRMGMPTLTATLMWGTCLDDEWTGKEYVELRGERYYIRQTPTSEKNNEDMRYKHSLEFKSEREQLGKVYFYDVVPSFSATYDRPNTNSTEFKFFGTIREYADRLNCAFRYAGIGDSILNTKTSLTDLDTPMGDGYCVVVSGYGGADLTVSKELSFSDQWLWDALVEGYNKYEIPFAFRGKKIVFNEYVEVTDHVFKYGYDNSLLSVRKNNANAKIVNRITFKGSSENIPYFYPNETEYGHISLVAGAGNSVFTSANTSIDKANLLTARLSQGESVTLIYKGRKATVSDIDVPTATGRTGDWFTINGSALTETHMFVDIDINITQPGEYFLNSLKMQCWRTFAARPFEGDSVTELVDRCMAQQTTTTKYGASATVVKPPMGAEDAIGYLPLGYLEAGSWTISTALSVQLPDEGTWAVRIYGAEVSDSSFEVKEGYYWRVGKKDYTSLAQVGLSSSVSAGASAEGDSFSWTAGGRMPFQTCLMPPKYRATSGAERFYNALNGTYPDGSGGYLSFPNPYVEGDPSEHIYEDETIKPTIEGVKNASGQLMGVIAGLAFDSDDSDSMKPGTDEESGKNDAKSYEHSFFYIKLNRFDGSYGFDLFKSASQTDPMTIQMTSGKCNGCKFKIQVIDEESLDERMWRNPVQVDGGGGIVDGTYTDKVNKDNPIESQQDTTKNSVWICVQKDADTFGVIMPNRSHSYMPAVGDTFNIINIDLPQGYKLAAEKRGEEAMLKFMAENNEEKFTFDISASRIFFADNKELLASLDENSRIKVEYDGKVYEQYVSEFGIDCKDGEALPEVKLTLTGALTVGQSFVQEIVGSIPKFDASASGGGASGGGGLSTALADMRYMRKDIPDRTQHRLSSDTGFEAGDFASGASGGFFGIDNETGMSYLETDFLKVRMKAVFEELMVSKVSSVRGKQIITPGGSVDISFVEDLEGSYRCYFKSKEEDKGADCSFAVGDQVICEEFNISTGITVDASNQFYWRKVTAVDNAKGYIELSKTDCAEGSGTPKAGDTICHLGAKEDKARQSAIVLSTVDANVPCVTLYNSIGEGDTLPLQYSLKDKAVVEYGVDKTKNPPQPFFNCYGRFYFGPRDKSSYLEFDPAVKKLVFRGELSVLSSIGDDTLEEYIKKNSGLTEDIEDFVEQAIKGVQDQIDGVIETWFYNGVPTLDNYPASGWDTENLKIQHLGDLYYDNDTGTAYRFSQNAQGGYYWNVITDDAITKALAEARKAQDTADGKRRVFTEQPKNTDAYDKGDLWVNATYGTQYSNDLLRCITAKAAGEAFSISHWTLASKYTDDTLAQAAKDAADKAQADADKAEADAKAAKDKLAKWAADGVISPPEKQGIKDEIARIDADKAHITAEYSRYGLGTPTAYNNAHGTYRSQLVSLSDDSRETIAIPSSFATNQTAYYNQRTEALKAIAAAAKTYADEVANKGKIYARGTGYNHNANRLVQVNGKEIVNGDGRGLTLTVINRSTLEKVSSVNYDCYISDDGRTALANALNALSTDVIAIITSWDAWSMDDALVSAMENFGATNLTGHNIRAPYAFIGMKGLGKGNGLQRIEGQGATDPYAEISTTVVNGICQGWNVNQAVYDTYDYLTEALKGSTVINGGLVLSSMFKLGTWTGSGNNATLSAVYAGMNGVYASGRSIASWWGGDMVDLFDVNDAKINPEPLNAAKALVRMDGSAYFSAGNIGFRKDGSGWLGSQSTGILFGADGTMTFGSGIKISTSSGDETLQSLVNFMQGLAQVFIPEDSSGNQVAWNASTLARVKSTVGFYSMGFISAKGLNTGGISGGGGSSSGGGATALSGLTDVSLTGLSAGQALVWNGSKWTNTTVSTGGGLDSNALASYLTSNGYITQTAMDGRYVTLSTAQTITGAKTFSTLLTATTFAATTAMSLSEGKVTGLVAGQTRIYGNGIAISNPATPNDLGWIRVTGTGETDTVLEIATGDDGGGGEQIVMRQYNTSNTVAHQIILMNTAGNQVLNTVTATQVLRAGVSGSWVNGRANALLRITTVGAAQYVPLWSAKTENGSWDCGSYIYDALHFSYITDTNFNAGTNFQTVDIQFTTAGHINAKAFVKNGGTSSQFLMADGSVKALTDITSAYVTALGTSGNYLTWTKNGAVNNITVTFAEKARLLEEAYGLSRGDYDSLIEKPQELPAGLRIKFKSYVGAGVSSALYWNTILDITSISGTSGNDAGYRNQFLFSNSANYSDGTFWVRNGVDETWNSWRKILTDANYNSVLDSSYVKKAGDTMTGLLTVNMPSSAVAALTLNTSSTSEIGFRLRMSGADKGWVGYHPTYGTNLYNYNCAKYLAINDSGVPNLSGSTLWHAGNDGSGSGLDADLLDGFHANGLFTQFANLTNGGGLNYGYRINVGGTQRDLVPAYFNFGYRSFEKPDNGGRPVIILLADVTAWSTATSNAGSYGGVMTVYNKRSNGYLNDNISFVKCACTYDKDHYELQTSTPSRVQPLILTRESDSKVFLALRLFGGGHYVTFVGDMINCPLWQHLTVSATATNRLPSGYTVLHGYTNWHMTANTDGEVTARRLEIFGATPYIDFHFNNSSADHTSRILEDIPGSLRIVGNLRAGTNTNSYALNAASFICDSWIRTTGATGWYNETYGGGWYMTDTTWIRSHNNKNIYQNTGIMRTDGTLQVGASGATLNVPSGADITHGQRFGPSSDNALCLGWDGRNYQGVHSRQFINNTNKSMIIWQGKNYEMSFATNQTYRMCITSAGSVVIGGAGMTASDNSPGVLRCTKGMYSDGYVSAKGSNTSSDMRLKRRLSDVSLSPVDIAAAPIFRFMWKKGPVADTVDVGSSAQYWDGKLHEAVHLEKDGFFSLDYAKAALCSAVSLARAHISLEERVKRLEKENEKLKHELLTIRHHGARL